MSSSRHGFLLTPLFTAIFLVGASSAESQTCDDLSEIDFGPCPLILGYGVIEGQCRLISGCSSPVPLFTTLEECEAACPPTCDDLSNIDFGPCDAILGVGVINGECQVISGCSSPVPLFTTIEECEAGCSPTCDDLSNIDFGPCDAVLGVGMINGECQVISGCSSPVPLFTTIEECESQCAVPIEPSTWGKIKSKYVKSSEE